MNNLVKTEKYLSKLLRHDPEDLALDEEGYAKVSEILSKIKVSKESLNDIVKNSNKKRFSFDKSGEKIRANQGHSIEVDLKFREFIECPDALFHGTTRKFLDIIKKDGIKKMKRHHVHLSQDLETAKNVGSRRGEYCILKIDAKKMKEDKIKFFISENNVVLTDYIDPKYIVDYIFDLKNYV